MQHETAAAVVEVVAAAATSALSSRDCCSHFYAHTTSYVVPRARVCVCVSNALTSKMRYHTASTHNIKGNRKKTTGFITVLLA